MNTFFGDNVNEHEPIFEKRIPNPDRLVEGYFRSQTTYNFLRNLVEDENLDELCNEHLDSNKSLLEE